MCCPPALVGPYWERLCPRAKFGRFREEVGGSMEAVKLDHLSGQANCHQPGNFSSKRGCKGKDIWVFWRNASNTILLPMDQSSRYTIPGYDAQSSEVVLSGFPNPLHLSSGQQLRMWYEEDPNDKSESDNGGTSCADVLVKYLWTQCRASSPFFLFLS